MFAVRIHGRGGQGVVTAAELLSLAAFLEERHAQAFPSFGSERTGAPVVSFCRIDDRPIRVREPIMEPDALIVQDPTLLHQVDVFGGMRPGGSVLINTGRTPEELGIGDLDFNAARRPGLRARAGARRPAAPECRAARRLRRALRHRLARVGHDRDPCALPAQGGGWERRGCGCRVRPRGGSPACRFAADAVEEGLLTRAQAIATIDAERLDSLLHPAFDPQAKFEVAPAGWPPRRARRRGTSSSPPPRRSPRPPREPRSSSSAGGQLRA